jgi:hypothetical protein
VTILEQIAAIPDILLLDTGVDINKKDTEVLNCRNNRKNIHIFRATPSSTMLQVQVAF